ncbi:hypothetical protein JHK84_040045 [Glycine max]|nr:hypothetical protein JHK84_040045 [Glycine max]
MVEHLRLKKIPRLIMGQYGFRLIRVPQMIHNLSTLAWKGSRNPNLFWQKASLLLVPTQATLHHRMWQSYRDNQLLDEEVDMDLEYLRMNFPGISYQSLVDVYNVNSGDLDAAIDMLSQLELEGDETSGILPETLDIGDVSESGLPADSASLKQKNVAEETNTSSSHMASANVL